MPDLHSYPLTDDPPEIVVAGHAAWVRGEGGDVPFATVAVAPRGHGVALSAYVGDPARALAERDVRPAHRNRGWVRYRLPLGLYRLRLSERDGTLGADLLFAIDARGRAAIVAGEIAVSGGATTLHLGAAFLASCLELVAANQGEELWRALSSFDPGPAALHLLRAAGPPWTLPLLPWLVPQGSVLVPRVSLASDERGVRVIRRDGEWRRSRVALRDRRGRVARPDLGVMAVNAGWHTLVAEEEGGERWRCARVLVAAQRIAAVETWCGLRRIQLGEVGHA